MAKAFAESVGKGLIDAKAAAKYLSVQPRTLYAYVSRGLVRSVPGARGRPRLYATADLERLKARRDARSGHAPVAAGALRWGEPVLDSAITAITPQGPAYRGRLATELAATGTRFENVAELLWSGYLPVEPIVWPHGAVPVAALAKLVTPGSRPLDVMPLIVQVGALGDPSRGDRRPDAIISRGRQLIPLLAAALAPDFSAAAVTRALGAGRISAIAARALGLDDSAADAIDVALIVLADHELNASSFAARIAASTEADPYACVAAALATVSGPKHGSAAEDIARLADEIGGPEQVKTAVRSLRKTGRMPVGFGHPLYPDGDPRATPLLAAARSSSNRRARTLVALADAFTADGDHPSVDVGLAAFVASLDVSPAAGSGLFAVARSAGWLAHALEQRAAGYLLRPRARYTGVPIAPR